MSDKHWLADSLVHGVMVDPGDEFNRDTLYYCAKCNRAHTREYKECDGLHGGWIPLEAKNAKELAEQANKLHAVHGKAVGTQTSALDVQVAGGHYKGKRIQPVEYISANNLNFLEGCIVKRITRWRDKPAKERFEDLEKIKHEVDLLIEMERKYGDARGEGQS